MRPLLSKASWSSGDSASKRARWGVKMSNHSSVFSCRNGSRVIQDRRIINQEDFEARVFKKKIQDGDWDAFPRGGSGSGQEGGKRNGIKREEGRRRREVRHPWAEEQVRLKSKKQPMVQKEHINVWIPKQDSDRDTIAGWGPRSRQEGQRGRAGCQEAEVWHSLLEEQGRHRDSLSFGELNQKFPLFPYFSHSLFYFISEYNWNKKKSQK